MRSILIIDDESSIQNALSGALEDEGFRVHLASSGNEGIEKLKSESPDIILLDIWMKGMDGLETLQQIKSIRTDQVVIMMSGHGTIGTAVKATKLGAFDFVEKPLSLERILVLIRNALKNKDLAAENLILKDRIMPASRWIGSSTLIQQLKERIRKVAPTIGSVLITGENGTGKELVARHIHLGSPRNNKPFIEVNCAAIPEDLIESELFGHEKGSFTGATQQRRGKFDLAHGGTLFLDEIGDMSFKTQAKILRILQEQKFERVGGSQTISVDVRIVAATNKDLKTEIQANRFREDLYYRLNVIPFVVPPLRDRKSDIPELAAHFMDEFSKSYGAKPRSLTPESMEILCQYSWPGNVRELRNLVERLVILTPEPQAGAPVTTADLFSLMKDELNWDTIPDEKDLGTRHFARSLRDARQEFEKEFILRTLQEQEGNVSKTASVLGVERSHLHKKIKSYGIEGKP